MTDISPQVLFVYGTFRPEDDGSPRNLDEGRILGEGTIPGVMFHLGGFPGVKPLEEVEGEMPVDDPRVVGDLIDFSDLDDEWEDRLATFDAIEGHPGLFERRKIHVKIDGDELLAWCYFYNRTVPSEVPVLEGGDWLERTPRERRI